MGDPVERPSQIRVQHPPAFRAFAPRGPVDRADRVMAATARPEPIGPRLEPRLPLGLQRVHDPSPMSPVENHVIPSGRRLPLLPRFGMYTRLTGRATNGSVLCCILSTKRILARGVSATSPSTPAVRRPALRSVTRRTLTSVLERDRSINFCRLRTLARSPACDAVKIRCPSRRTLSSAARQSTWRQSRVASSGPFTTTLVAASNSSVGSGVVVIFLFTGSPDRVSALSSPGTRPGIRPVMRDGKPEGASHTCPGFPLPFGCRHSLLGHQIPAEGLGLPHGRLTGQQHRTSTGVTAFRMHELRPGWVPPVSRGRRCSSRLSAFLRRRLPLFCGQSLHSATASHQRS